MKGTQKSLSRGSKKPINTSSSAARLASGCSTPQTAAKLATLWRVFWLSGPPKSGPSRV